MNSVNEALLSSYSLRKHMLNPTIDLHKVLLDLGYSPDYEPTYSLKVAGAILCECIDFTKIKGADKDIRWLANHFVRVIAKTKDACIDNHRVALVVDGNIPEDYTKRQDAGCCGFFDRKLVNPHTGNTYIFGFNFGH